MRLLFLQGSPRNPEGEAHQAGKTRALLAHAVAEAERLGAEVDVLDLSVSEEGARVQPCYGCISTAGGYHCHYPCDCYRTDDPDAPPDFLAQARAFDRVQAADALLTYCPVNWYSVPTQVKAAFDRFVCASLTLTRRDAVRLLGRDRLKDAQATRAACKAHLADDLLTNHWAGKVAGFFVHGDDGADDYAEREKPRSLQLYPDVSSPVNDPRAAVLPLVQQMRYSGVNVPGDLIVSAVFNRGTDYATANDVIRHNHRALDLAAELVRRTMALLDAGRSRT